ncbi:hypothetical protein RFI_29065 [Reticulomyxa filosa]|uniref:Uncharacterized protein n=1 Tax=Reticulomyxa filosa TaxID=46433 RepID=X6M2C8_RETFI|nr:hypothetical protein RFI_29065 [Reticulomyxa filosa]|eukprot:ETO08323.1 hypothetical protein RFI_29065 [Reticulomyxa filosa]
MSEAKILLEQDLQTWLAYCNILYHINMNKIVDCYNKIHCLCEDATKYAYLRPSYRVLWDLKSFDVCDALGDNIGKWIKVLNDMKQIQSVFEKQHLTHYLYI